VSAAITATASFLGSQRQAAAFRVSGNNFTKIRHEARVWRDSLVEIQPESEVLGALKELRKEYASEVDQIELPSNRYFAKTSKRIEQGVLDYGDSGDHKIQTSKLSGASPHLSGLASGLALAVRRAPDIRGTLARWAHGSGGCRSIEAVAARTTTCQAAWSIRGPRGTDVGLSYDRLEAGYGYARHPEKRKVDSSILSLTTSTGHARRALTCDNANLGRR
jgi:hypothetical protein